MRLNASNGNFLKIENMNLNTIINESCKRYKFNPATNLGVLFNVLFNINKLTTGKYILHHTPKHGAFAAVMKSQWYFYFQNKIFVNDNFFFNDKFDYSDKGSLNLSELYKEENCTIGQSLKWNPIDTTLILPYHVENNFLPGIFPPACADKFSGGKCFFLELS